MKVALVVPGFSSGERDWGIPALLDFVSTLTAYADVHVFSLRWPDRETTYELLGARVHAMGGGNHIGWRAVAALWRRALSAIQHEHRRRPFDVIHAFWADEPAWLASVSSRRLGVPLVVSIAGGELVALRDIGYGLQLLRGRAAPVRCALAQAQCVTVGSRYLLEIARRFVPARTAAKIVRAPLGIDTTTFSPAAYQSDSVDQVITVGSLCPVKGHVSVLKVFAAVPHAHLIVAGEGPLREQLEEEARRCGIADRVQFAGRIDRADLVPLYRCARVFVQGSRHEAQGVAVLEAAACGVPAVGTAVGVLPEVGIAVRSDEELVTATVDILQDRERYRLARERALDRVRAEFSLSAAHARFVSIYEQAVSS